MTKRRYVHVQGAGFGDYRFFPPYEDTEGQTFATLQEMLSWAGAHGWRLVCANHDFTEFVFERQEETALTFQSVRVEFEKTRPPSTE
jgi:hypothetical protein